MPALSMSRQATRDFENVRIEVAALVSNFNASVLDILDKYHQCTLDHCSSELGVVKTQLIEKDRELDRFRHELDYRTGYIIRLEKERSDLVRINSELVRDKITLAKENSDLLKLKEDLQAEIEARVMEARKIASLERLDLRPTRACLVAQQVESEPESAATHPRDLESVVSRLKKQKNPRQVTRRRHTVDIREAERGTSVLAQAEPVPDLVSADSVVTVTERTLTVKEEGYDVDDNDVDVLLDKEVDKPVVVMAASGDGIDTVDEATNKASGETRGSVTSDAASSLGTGAGSSQDAANNETGPEPTSDTSSDAERSSNNNDHTFINLQSDQLSLPLKKRKPQTKKRATKTPEPEIAEKAKAKPRSVKALSTGSRLSQGSRSSVESRISSASVAISEDEITPLPDSTSDRPKALKRRRAVSLDTEVRAPARRTTKNSRQARHQSDSELEDLNIDLTPKPDPAPDPTKQILEIGVVHASNTPILSKPKPANKPAKVKRARARSRSLSQAKGKSKKKVIYDCTQCSESFTGKAQFQKHTQHHRAKKRKIESPVIENNENLVPQFVNENQPIKNEALVIKVPVDVVREAEQVVTEVAEKKEKKRTKKKKEKRKTKDKKVKKDNKKVEECVEKELEVSQPEVESKTPELEIPASNSEKKCGTIPEPEVEPEDSVDQNSVQQNVVDEVQQNVVDEQPNVDVSALNIKIEPNGRDTPSSLGRNTPSSFGRSTPGVGRATPTFGRATPLSRRRTYQGPLHRCSECPATFKYKYCLDNHRGVHTQAHQYKCSRCSASFRTQKALNDHALLHDNEQAATCLVCQMSFANQDLLSAHVVAHHCDKPPTPDTEPSSEALICVYCGHVCESTEEMTEHVTQHKNDRSWKCSYCPATFRWKGSLDVHLARHQEVLCPHCGMVLANKDQLETHINTEHTLKFEVLTGAEAIAQAMGDF